MPRGRPLTFDKQLVLDRALEVFWTRGYEGAAIAELLGVMEIRAASLYAAFGDKRGLFHAALTRYGERGGDYAARALAEERTAEDAVRRMFTEAATFFSAPEHPAGCLVMSAAANCRPENDDIAQELRDARAEMRERLRALAASDNRRGAGASTLDPNTLADFAAVVIHGMSAFARDGATQQQLESVAAIAADAIRTQPNSDTEPLGQRGG